MKLENVEVSSQGSQALQLREAKSKSKSGGTQQQQGPRRALGTSLLPAAALLEGTQGAQLGPLLAALSLLAALPGCTLACQRLGRAAPWPWALTVVRVLQARGGTAPRTPAGTAAPAPETPSPTTVTAARASRAGSASWVSATLLPSSLLQVGTCTQPGSFPATLPRALSTSCQLPAPPG